MRSKLITIKISDWLLLEIDEAAKANFASRSGFIREAVVMRLNDQKLTSRPRLEDTLELLRKADSQARNRNNGG